MNSEISIIIPTYNRSHLIGKTLESILAQTFQNWKCIVVDDNSTDNTNEVMKDYCEKDQRIRFIKRPSNLKKGANSCRNYGFEKSSSPFIKWFDSDDIMYPNHLELMYSKLVDNDLDFVISDSRNFDSETGKII
jgi:glycosyltransferase involved in cell wall biosynthesis